MKADHQALQAAFSQKNIYDRFARCIVFLAEHDSEIQYGRGRGNKAADFHSQISHGEGSEGQTEEKDFLAGMVLEEAIESAISNLETALHVVILHFALDSLEKMSVREESGIPRQAMKYIWNEGHL